jgi:hypothetical protein
MDAPAVLHALGEPSAFSGSPPHWGEAMRLLSANRGLPFLETASLGERLTAAQLPAERLGPLHEVAELIAQDPALTAMATYLYYRVFVAPEHGSPWGAPSLSQVLGSRAGLFYLLLCLEFPKRLAAYHESLGYPAEVTAETVKQIGCYEANHLRGAGGPGVYPPQFAWLTNYFVSPFVRHGRFEYQLKAYGGGVQVFRRASDGAVIALAEGGQNVDADGLLALRDTSPAFVTRLDETRDAVVGFPVLPDGRIVHKLVRLPKTAYTRCLAKGETILDLHIPAGGAMDWDSMVTSTAQAHEFFARHHADRDIRALVVTTWFMDPRLAELLPATSNPLRLQRATYLYPTGPDPESLWFVFLRPIQSANVAELPGDSSLQRALKDFLARGGVWHGGGFFLLREHMAELCENRYRQGFESLANELGFAEHLTQS